MKTITKQINEDAKELRDIADWFDQQNKKENGDLLRQIAHKLEIVWGAYLMRTGDNDGKLLNDSERAKGE